MKTRMKALTLVLCAVLLVCASVMGTLAYLKSTSDTVVNTFTVGKVAIKLDEAPVDEYGKVVTGNRRIANTYKLLPGHTYVKDPMVTVLADSESSYIRMIVTVKNYSKLLAAIPQFDENNEVIAENAKYYAGDGKFLLQTLVDGWNNNIWTSTENIVVDSAADTATYEFRYYNTVDTLDKQDKELEKLFTHVVVPGDLTNEEILALNGVVIDIVAHAIQADGFADVYEAYTNNPVKLN